MNRPASLPARKARHSLLRNLSRPLPRPSVRAAAPPACSHPQLSRPHDMQGLSCGTGRLPGVSRLAALQGRRAKAPPPVSSCASFPAQQQAPSQLQFQPAPASERSGALSCPWPRQQEAKKEALWRRIFRAGSVEVRAGPGGGRARRVGAACTPRSRGRSASRAAQGAPRVQQLQAAPVPEPGAAAWGRTS